MKISEEISEISKIAESKIVNRNSPFKFADNRYKLKKQKENQVSFIGGQISTRLSLGGSQVFNLRVAVWNSQGLTAAKRNMLMNWMGESSIDVAIVTETHFRPNTAIPSVCEGLSAVCSVLGEGATAGKRGVSVIINQRTLSEEVTASIRKLEADDLQGSYLAFEIAGVKFLCIYNAPELKLQLDDWLNELCEKIGIRPMDQVVIAGDFNARHECWKDRKTNDNGRKLAKWAADWEMHHADSGKQATFVGSQGHSIVDHFFHNLADDGAFVSREMENASDHRPVVMKLRIEEPALEPIKHEFRIRVERLKKWGKLSMLYLNELEDFGCDWSESLRNDLDGLEACNDQRTKQQLVDHHESQLNRFLTATARKICGTSKVSRGKIRWEPVRSRKLTRLCYKLRKEGGSKVKSAIDREVEKLSKKKFDKYVEKLDEMPINEVVKVVSSFNKRRSRKATALKSDDASIESYKSYFAGMTRNLLARKGKLSEAPVRTNSWEELEEIARLEFNLRAVIRTMRRLPWNKAPGNSGVTYGMLKRSGPFFKKSLSFFFRMLLLTQTVPTTWKTALICPVPKKGDLSVIDNYRPISLTESLRKVFEHLLLGHLKWKAGPMHFAQGGFRSFHSCNDMIVSLHEALRRSRGKYCVAFLDIKAAYDSVDREILWHRCASRGITAEMIALLQSMFDGNTAQILVNGKRSSPFRIEAGVLQGSVLSPFLYSLFIDDLARELENGPKIKVGSLQMNSTFYADDIALVAESPKQLQELLDICNLHAQRNRYRFNVAKCAYMNGSETELLLQGERIPKVPFFKYLGVEMNLKGIMHNVYLHRRCDETIEAGRKMVGMGMNIGGFGTKILSNLYKTFVRSKLEASLCILPPIKTIAVKAESSQHLVLTRMLRVSRSTSQPLARALLAIPSMTDRIKWLRSSFVRRFDCLPVSHIVKRSNDAPRNWIDRLRSSTFAPDSSREDVRMLMMRNVADCARSVTNGCLDLFASYKPPWFMTEKIPKSWRRLIVTWILKKYNPYQELACQRCGYKPLTQSHIAYCCDIFSNFPARGHIIKRYVPEWLLSQGTVSLDVFALEIARCVELCFPKLQFNFAHDDFARHKTYAKAELPVFKSEF